MRISVRFNQDIAIMVLEGKFLAGSDGPFLRQKVKDLIDAGVKKLLLDFTGVPYIDSTGLGFLAGSRATAEKSNVKIVLGGVNLHVRKILDDVKLTRFFTFVPDEKSGVQELQRLASSGAEDEPRKNPRGKKASPAASE